MSDVVEQLRATIGRPAALFEVGGFRPLESLDAPWLGRANLAAPGELWPEDER